MKLKKKAVKLPNELFFKLAFIFKGSSGNIKLPLPLSLQTGKYLQHNIFDTTCRVSFSKLNYPTRLVFAVTFKLKFFTQFFTILIIDDAVVLPI